MRAFIILVTVWVAAGFITTAAQARPVSYPGGWTVMLMNDIHSNNLHVHYSPTAFYSLGWQHEYLRGPEAHVDTLKWNWLVKRWNTPTSQANLYLRSGAGIIYDREDRAPALYSGIAADWETRRWFTAYENNFFHGGNIEKFAAHKARIGVAPYIGGYGDLHTWLMLQADYNPGSADDFSLTPLVRFFKGSTMIEAGYNLDRGVLFNFVQRF